MGCVESVGEREKGENKKRSLPFDRFRLSSLFSQAICLTSVHIYSVLTESTRVSVQPRQARGRERAGDARAERESLVSLSLEFRSAVGI